MTEQKSRVEEFEVTGDQVALAALVTHFTIVVERVEDRTD
jgi:hypothetical protein